MQISKINLNLFSANSTLKSSYNYAIPFFGIKGKKSPTVDTFEKSPKTKQSEDKQSFDEFKKWSKDNGYFSKHDSSKLPELTLIDSSNQGKTYKMQGTDKWVLKKLYNAEIIPATHSKTVVKNVKDKIPSINIGQTIARIEIPVDEANSKLYFINKKQNGHSVALPEQSASRYDFNLDENREAFKSNIEEIAKAPQKAFDDLVGNTLYLLMHNYDIDTENPQNIIYDSKEKEFHIKNIKHKNSFDENIAEWYANYNKPNTHYSNIFTALLGGKYGIKYYQDTTNKDYKNALKDESMANNLLKITIKYANAMKRNATSFIETDSLNKILRSGVLDNIIQSQGTSSRFNELQRMTIE